MRTKSWLFAALVLAACGGDNVAPIETPQVDAAVGQYVLSSLGGKPVPAESGSLIIKDGGLNINAEGTWAWWFNHSNLQGGQSGLSGVNGTWVRLGPNTLEVTATSAPFAGQKQELTVTGSTATRVDGWVFKR